MNVQNSLGKLLGLECHAKGAYILLGPMLNIQHGQLGGLGFKGPGFPNAVTSNKVSHTNLGEVSSSPRTGNSDS
jgi:hypothetical protein